MKCSVGTQMCSFCRVFLHKEMMNGKVSLFYNTVQCKLLFVLFFFCWVLIIRYLEFTYLTNVIHYGRENISSQFKLHMSRKLYSLSTCAYKRKSIQYRCFKLQPLCPSTFHGRQLNSSSSCAVELSEYLLQLMKII